MGQQMSKSYHQKVFGDILVLMKRYVAANPHGINEQKSYAKIDWNIGMAVGSVKAYGRK